MPAALIGGAISGGASIISGLLGGSAASKAAAQEAAAAQQAASGIKQAQGQSTAQQNQTTAGITSNLQPFVGLGQQSANSLANLLAPGGSLTQSYQGINGQFAAPTAAQAAATPGYQFQLQQGENALQNSAAARGGLLSTGTAKNLENYAQGVASTNYGNAYNQALQAYQTNLGAYQNSQNSLYNMLAGTSQLGASTGTALGGLQQQGANALTNINLTGAQDIGGYLTQAGQAQAAGTVGGANALNAGIQGGANAVGQGITLQGLLGAMNASNTGTAPLAGVNPNSLSYSSNIGPSYVPPEGGLPVYQ